MDTTGIRLNEPVSLVPIFFLIINTLEKQSLGVKTKFLEGIVIPSVSELMRSFSGSMKIPYPTTVCNLWNHIPYAGSIASCTGKKLPTNGRHVYSAPEV
jgi:hypothetical protein